MNGGNPIAKTIRAAPTVHFLRVLALASTAKQHIIVSRSTSSYRVTLSEQRKVRATDWLADEQRSRNST